MLEPLEPQTEMPVNVTEPTQVKAVDAIPDNQVKAKMEALKVPTAAEVKAAVEQIASGQAPVQDQAQTFTQSQTQTQAPEAAAQPDAVGQPPAEAQPQEPKVEVPQKFQTQDGKVDVAKVEKSTLAAEDALKLYREKEAELRRKMNEVNNLQKQVAPVHPQAQVQQAQVQGAQAGLTPAQVEDHIKKVGAGQAILDIAALLVEQNQRYTAERVAAIEQREAQKESEDQLRKIGQADPWVFTPQGMGYLFDLRNQYPELNASRNPMQAAYEKHLALEVLKSRQVGQVQTPTPTPTAAKAPPTPAGGVRPTVSAPTLNINDDNAVRAHAAKLPPAESAKFYADVLRQRGVRIR